MMMGEGGGGGGLCNRPTLSQLDLTEIVTESGNNSDLLGSG